MNKNIRKVPVTMNKLLTPVNKLFMVTGTHLKPLRILLITILTSIQFPHRICQIEDMGQFLFDGSDAAGILAFHYIL